MAAGEMAALRKVNPSAAQALDYAQAPILAQLDAGVRQIELDVYGDTKGGLFAAPAFLRLGGATMPAGWAEAMGKPGFKVLHVSDVDFRSHCWTFVACLEQVRGWSRAHPRHLPIYILVENKDGKARQPGFAQPEEITAATMDGLDGEIRSVFGAAEVVTPDMVRGGFATLEEAVLRKGWPLLEAARGKVVFLLDQERVTGLYTAGHASLRGRMMFTNATPGTADAAFVKVNDARPGDIAGLVKKGYLVRTMTDGSEARRDAALASGAQMLSTDYPFGWKSKTGFHVDLGGAVARCNPVNGGKGCVVSAE
jgi:hypothetical protein